MKSLILRKIIGYILCLLIAILSAIGAGFLFLLVIQFSGIDEVRILGWTIYISLAICFFVFKFLRKRILQSEFLTPPRVIRRCDFAKPYTCLVSHHLVYRYMSEFNAAKLGEWMLDKEIKEISVDGAQQEQ